MKKLSPLTILGLALAAHAATAQILNNDIPVGWTAVGNAGEFASDIGELAPSGTLPLEFISTANSAATGIGYGLGTETNGSTLTTSTFSATAGSSLSMSFAFVTTDAIGYDYGFANLIDATSGKTVAVLFDINSAAVNGSSGFKAPGTGLPTMAGVGTSEYFPGADSFSGSPDFPLLGNSSGTCSGAGCGFSYLEPYTYTFASTGSYKLQFGVTNTFDTEYDSALGIDLNALTLNGTPLVSSVPEPSAYVMVLAGILVVRSFAKKRRSLIIIRAGSSCAAGQPNVHRAADRADRCVP